MPKIKLVEQSTHWKDRAAGWHKYKVTYVCQVCGKPCSEICWGTYEEVRDSYAGSEKWICSAACEKKAEAAKAAAE